MFKLRPYQQETSDEVIELLKTHKSVLCVIPTGGGKSVIISDIVNRLQGRTLILTHREEILKQNIALFDDIGVLTAKTSTNLTSDKVIAMVETFYRRAEKLSYSFLGEFDNVLTDESHILIFQKVYDKIKYKRLVGMTATPTTMKVENITVKGVQFVKRYAMGDYFDVMVEGAKVSELIELGYLTKEVAYSLRVPNFDRKDENQYKQADYTNTELDKIYSNKSSRGVLLEAYNKFCVGKKVIIFNATTKVNIEVADMLIGVGANVFSYDSVNNKSSERNEIIKEFKDCKDGVLVNANVFTTGFDAPDIDVVIINRATKSLSLWIQMVGRASRIAPNKQQFISIDLGQNVDAFGKWSSDVNWHEEFKIKALKKKNKSDILNIWECDVCGAFNTHDELVCVVCSAEKDIKKHTKTTKSGIIELVDDKPQFPNGLELIRYTKRINQGSTFAFNLAHQQITKTISYTGITKTFYKENKSRIEHRILEVYRPIYFAIIKSTLKGKNRKFSTQFKSLTQKIKDSLSL